VTDSRDSSAYVVESSVNVFLIPGVVAKVYYVTMLRRICSEVWAAAASELQFMKGLNQFSSLSFQANPIDSYSHFHIFQ
jgi:hypothetical protein